MRRGIEVTIADTGHCNYNAPHSIPQISPVLVYAISIKLLHFKRPTHIILRYHYSSADLIANPNTNIKMISINRVIVKGRSFISHFKVNRVPPSVWHISRQTLSERSSAQNELPVNTRYKRKTRINGKNVRNESSEYGIKNFEFGTKNTILIPGGECKRHTITSMTSLFINPVLVRVSILIINFLFEIYL